MDSPQKQEIQQVNIKKLFSDKSPKLARWIPGFVYRYLRRVICEDEANAFLKKHGGKSGYEFVEASLEHWNVTLEIKGKENLPENPRHIFVSNHPLGGFDGVCMLKAFKDSYGDVRVLVNDILMNVTNLREFFIPINKHGGQRSELLQVFDDLYKSDMPVFTFPAGYVSRKIKGQVMDLPWQKNFIAKAKQYQRNVVPIHFSGQNSKFFYRLYQVRKFFGIKANLEMLYLVDETFKHKNKKLVITIGKPIPYSTFDASKKPIEWAKWVKEQAYLLGGVTSIPV